jgi:hypothetical protein
MTIVCNTDSVDAVVYPGSISGSSKSFTGSKEVAVVEEVEKVEAVDKVDVVDCNRRHLENQINKLILWRIADTIPTCCKRAHTSSFS